MAMPGVGNFSVGNNLDFCAIPMRFHLSSGQRTECMNIWFGTHHINETVLLSVLEVLAGMH